MGVVGEAGFGRHAHGEVGGDAVDRAEVVGGDEVADVDGEGEVARPDCFHEEEVLFEGKGGQKTLRMTWQKTKSSRGGKFASPYIPSPSPS